MDFITHLPPCQYNGQTFTNILVVVDRLTKKKKFIPMTSLRVDALVQAFVEYVWREEGYPEEIISDRGSQFVSHFWRRLCQRLGVHPKFSTAFHPQTDGQTEIANAWLKQYLRAFVNYAQDNWALFLPMAEFEANSTISTTTGFSPFYATKGYQPRTGLEPPLPVTGTQPAKHDKIEADKFAERIQQLQTELRNAITWAQAKQAEYANMDRYPAPAFKVGDYVMLDTRNFRTTRPNQSLDFKNRGPYQITRVIDNCAYQLALPPGLGRLHNVFHPWLLHPAPTDPAPFQQHEPEGDIDIDPAAEDSTDYDIDAILDSRIDKKQLDPVTKRRGLLQYHIRWADYPLGPDNPSWEPFMNLIEASQLVAEFHLQQPRKPGPHPKFTSLTEQQSLLIIRLEKGPY